MLRSSRLCVCLLLLLCSSSVFGQTESGKFRLHKFEQPLGEESYTIAVSGDKLDLESSFSFTDRTTNVPLKASLTSAPDYTPQAFSIKGSTSRFTQVDNAVTISGPSAQVRTGTVTTTVQVSTRFFTILGYAPAAMEMALMRYWRSHGSPASLPILPSGEVRVSDRGTETFTISGREVKLERYAVKGLVWGIETLWMDQSNRLAALVTRDAEFDHFEAIAEPYESALPLFVSHAAGDAMADLTELGGSLPGRRTGTLALIGATLIDGTGRPPAANTTIIIQNGKILAAGTADHVPIPEGATKIDEHGRFIVPGLWDMHAHYEQVEWGPIYLAAGITTVRDVGNEFEFITRVRDKLREGALGPNLMMAGVVDGTGPATLGVNIVNSPADAAQWVKRYHDSGFQQIKVYSSVSEENLKAVCADAHALGMTVTGHIPEGMNVYQGVNDGMDQVNHIPFLVQPLLPKDFDPHKGTREDRLRIRANIDVNSQAGIELVSFLKNHHTVIDDTTALFELIAPGSPKEPGAAHLAPELRQPFEADAAPPEIVALSKAYRGKLIELLGALHRGGVTVVAGTDQAVPGYSLYRELELYVEAGFTPLEALQAATIVPAQVMKVDSQLGTIEAGKRADLAILDADPLADIHNIRTVRSVIANGLFFDSAPLWTSVGFTP